jgi:hypothetical protein
VTDTDADAVLRAAQTLRIEVDHASTRRRCGP